MDTVQIVAIIAVVVVAMLIYTQVKEKLNLKKAASGEDKMRLRQVVAQVLPNESGYQVAYAHWEKVEYFGRRTRTTYYCYALAFDASCLWIMPLRFKKQDILPGQPILLTSDTLGIAEVNPLANKNGLWRVGIALHDKDGKRFLDAYVDATNTREDSYHHMNILQGEECLQFSQFMASFASQVNQENQELQQSLSIKAFEEKCKRSRILGIIGLVLCIIFPFFSIILGGIGLVFAPKPRETGGKASPPMILCALSLVFGLIITAAWIFIFTIL